MYICDNRHEESIEICNKYDRINLKNAYFHSAKYHELNKNYPKAIEHFTLANLHKEHIVKMLILN